MPVLVYAEAIMVDNAYNFDHPDIANYSNNSNNIQPVLIEGQLTYLDADKIVCMMNLAAVG